MDIFTNLNEYLKTLKSQQSWNTKRSNMIHLTSKAEMRQSLIEALSPPPREISIDEIRMKIDKIKSKLRAGGRLTANEKQFLYKNAPDVLRKLCEIEKARSAFAQRLRACKSQQEMEHKMNTELSSAAAIGDPQDPDMASIIVGQLSAAMRDVGTKCSKPRLSPEDLRRGVAAKYTQSEDEEDISSHTHYTNHA